MKKVILGRTGLEVSVAGLGAGGHSRIGFEQYGLQHAAMIVKTAYENGINFFDTATIYGTEGAVGLGLEGISRENYVLSTKFPYSGMHEQKIKTPAILEQTLNESLKALRVDYIDIYSLHGVSPEDYAQTMDTFFPAMEKAQKHGKIRFLGITERFSGDTGHLMLQKALPGDHFDVIMTGYNIINPSAAKRVLPMTIEKNVGVQCMFAVRKALSNPNQLKADIERILEMKQADPSLMESYGTLGFLVEEGAAGSIIEAAYRFCSNTPGIHVTLTGTGSAEHLINNIKAIQMSALPGNVLDMLGEMFGNVDCISGQSAMW